MTDHHEAPAAPAAVDVVDVVEVEPTAPAEPPRHPHSAGLGVGSKFPVDEAPNLVDGEQLEDAEVDQ